MSSLLGVIGGLRQNKRMVYIFGIHYGFITTLILFLSIHLCIITLVKQDSIVEGCRKIIMGTSPTINVIKVEVEEENSYCIQAIKQFLLISGISLFMINFIQIYFGFLIFRFAKKLRRKFLSS
ncbi:uncharacterized protein BX663DRAFT_509331 [Cokeromyces recurvatus]|uniref:uncharacterized protein n=1 Tax=Cokeromyces recurvatus TaxID=90255 RepID=UPI00221FDD48|nr:uncharacterized protein BX663DRAFT_509331 [Cokeromyces recurvatus]KAI7903042.1 hypothetical protein BX663DRAFT_509331 [Cokeromyces recurvatus]